MDFCPKRMVHEHPLGVSRIFSLYKNYVDGYLPEPGGATDQPAKLMDMFEQIATVRAILDEQDMDKNRNPNNGGDGNFRSIL